MTLDVSERLRRDFQELAKRRKAARGQIDTAPPSVSAIQIGFRKSTKETISDLVPEISKMRSCGLTYPEITKGFNARFGSQIASSTFQIYFENAMRESRSKSNG